MAAGALISEIFNRPRDDVLYVGKRQEGEEGADGEEGDVDGLLGGKREGQDSCGGVQGNRLTVPHVPPHDDDQPKRQGRHENVVAGKSAEVEKRGGEGQQDARAHRPRAAKPVAKKPGQRDQTRAHKGVGDARRRVVIAEEEEDQRVEVVLQRAVQQGVVLVAAAHGYVPTVEGVQALVVVHGAVAQLPHAHHQRDENEGDVEGQLPAERQPCRRPASRRARWSGRRLRLESRGVVGDGGYASSFNTA